MRKFKRSDDENVECVDHCAVRQKSLSKRQLIERPKIQKNVVNPAKNVDDNAAIDDFGGGVLAATMFANKMLFAKEFV